MNFFLTNHDEQRMKERFISTRLIKAALQKPDQMLYDKDERLLIKRVYTKKGKRRLLIIVAVRVERQIKIITVIDTSKIKKYYEKKWL